MTCPKINLTDSTISREKRKCLYTRDLEGTSLPEIHFSEKTHFMIDN